MRAGLAGGGARDRARPRETKSIRSRARDRPIRLAPVSAQLPPVSALWVRNAPAVGEPGPLDARSHPVGQDEAFGAAGYQLSDFDSFGRTARHEQLGRGEWRRERPA